MVDFPASGTPMTGAGPAPATASRRALIAAGVGAAGLLAAGCTVDNPVSENKTPRAPAELAPDVAVATRALAEIKAVRVAVTRTVSRYPAARPGLIPLVSMHQAHEKSLADAVPERARPPSKPAPYAVPRRRAAALKRLATREQGLHATIDALALRAQSGDFARLLASMGAAVDQRLAVWPQ